MQPTIKKQRSEQEIDLMVIEEEHEAGLSNDEYSPNHPSGISSNSRSKELENSHLHRLQS